MSQMNGDISNFFWWVVDYVPLLDCRGWEYHVAQLNTVQYKQYRISFFF